MVPGIAVRVALCYRPRVQSPEPPKDDLVHSEAFLHSLMRRQLRLSVFCAGMFLVLLIGLPLLNYHFPERMAERVLGGFTVSWFLLGIGVFPAVWWIARWPASVSVYSYFCGRAPHASRRMIAGLSGCATGTSS